MKKLFIQDVDILNTNIIVVCCNDDELKSMIKKSRLISKECKKELEEIETSNANGNVFYNIKTSQPLLLYMKNVKKDWKFFETLLHETNHVVYYFMKAIEIHDETEFEARLHEMLFREIRKKLSPKDSLHVLD